MAWTSKRWPWHVRRKTTFANIHVKNMTHVTELELNTRAFALPFVHIPFIPVGRTKVSQECAKIFLQVGSSAVRFKNVPLTTESKISLRSRSCSPAINITWCRCQWLYFCTGTQTIIHSRISNHENESPLPRWSILRMPYMNEGGWRFK